MHHLQAPACPCFRIREWLASFLPRAPTPGVAIRTLGLFFFLLRQPLSDVWWLPTNRHRLPTNRHRLHTNRHRLHTNRHRLPTNRHRLPTNRHRLHTSRHRLHTNRHRLHTNRHRLPTNRHQLPTGRHHRAYWTLRVFFFLLWQPLPNAINVPHISAHRLCRGMWVQNGTRKQEKGVQLACSSPLFHPTCFLFPTPLTMFKLEACLPSGLPLGVCWSCLCACMSVDQRGG